MTVQGGGGGKKVPAATTTPLKATPTTAASTPAKATPSSTTPAPQAAVDGFELGVPPVALPLPALETHSPSGIDSMVRVLEDTRANILDEHKQLRARISKLVAELVRSGFERSAMEERHAELQALRTRMAALRKRLHQIQRRLKTVVGKTKSADVEMGKQLSTQLDRLRKLEPGLERALLALQMMEVAFVEAWGGHVVKVKVGDDGDAAAMGDAIANAAPGAAVVSGVVRALGAGLATGDDDTDGAAADDASDGLQRLQDLATSLKKSF